MSHHHINAIHKINYLSTEIESLYQAELDSFNTWTEDEISTYISLMEKYANCFRAQIEKW